MTSLIDSDHSLINDICPNLPPSTIFALLSVHELDNDLRQKPDVNRFGVTHQVDLYAEFVPTPLDTQALFEIRSDASTEEWASVAVPAEILAQCQFLRDRFHG
jgi:hypothetical protein